LKARFRRLAPAAMHQAAQALPTEAGLQSLELSPYRATVQATEGPLPAAMHQAAQALPTEAGLQSLELSHGKAQRPGALLVRDLARQGCLDEPSKWHFLPAHRESLHKGMTFSRSSEGGTFS